MGSWHENAHTLYTLYALYTAHALEDAGLAGLGVACQGLMGAEMVEGVVPGPALLTEVLEATDGPAEEWSRVPVAGVADTVLQVWLYLDLFREFWGLNLHEVHLYGSEVAVMGGEGNPPGPYRVLILVRVYPGVHNIPEQLVHRIGQSVSV